MRNLDIIISFKDGTSRSLYNAVNVEENSSFVRFIFNNENGSQTQQSFSIESIKVMSVAENFLEYKIEDKKDSLKMVKRGWWNICFVKKDKTKREMCFTIDQTNIPLVELKETITVKYMTTEEKEAHKIKKEKEKTSPYINVYEMGEGWRKINVEKIIELEEKND